MENNIIEFENAAIFQKDVMVLSGVNFKISRGEFVYLIGKTGTGKSSLLRTIYADLPLKQGFGLVAGYSLAGIEQKEIPFLRRKLGIVFQDFQLLNDRTVYENLLFVMKATGWKDKLLMQSRIADVLEKVELGTKGFKMPNQLSGGEQQRVAIARALINSPEIILADEPTGNLDPETSAGLMNLLLEITQSGTAVLMATHDYSLFRSFPARTVKCENGELISTENLSN